MNAALRHKQVLIQAGLLIPRLDGKGNVIEFVGRDSMIQQNINYIKLTSRKLRNKALVASEKSEIKKLLGVGVKNKEIYSILLGKGYFRNQHGAVRDYQTASTLISKVRFANKCTKHEFKSEIAARLILEGKTREVVQNEADIQYCTLRLVYKSLGIPLPKKALPDAKLNTKDGK